MKSHCSATGTAALALVSAAVLFANQIPGRGIDQDLSPGEFATGPADDPQENTGDHITPMPENASRETRVIVQSPASWGHLVTSAGDVDRDGFDDFSTTAGYAIYDRRQGYTGPPMEIRSGRNGQLLLTLDSIPFLSGSTSPLVEASFPNSDRPHLLAAGIAPGTPATPGIAILSPETEWKTQLFVGPEMGSYPAEQDVKLDAGIAQFGRARLCHLSDKQDGRLGMAVALYPEGRRRCTLIAFRLDGTEPAFVWSIQWSAQQLAISEPRAIAEAPDVDGDGRHDLAISMVAPAEVGDQRTVLGASPRTETPGVPSHGEPLARPAIPGIYILSSSDARVLQYIPPARACDFFGISLSVIPTAEDKSGVPKPTLLVVGSPVISAAGKPRCADLSAQGITGSVDVIHLEHGTFEGSITRRSAGGGSMRVPRDGGGQPVPDAFGVAIASAAHEGTDLLFVGDPRVPIQGSVHAVRLADRSVLWSALGNEGGEISPSSDYNFGSQLTVLFDQGKLAGVLVAARNPSADSGRIVLLDPATGTLLREFKPTASKPEPVK